jgi:excisionase family DNA binding protein
MITLNHTVFPEVLNNHMSVQMAASYSGYSAQYLRRLLRANRVGGIKIGQMWLIEKAALDFYVEQAQCATDKRFGPK